MVVVLSSWVVALVIVAGLSGSTAHQARNEWSPTVGNQVSLPIGPHTFGDAQNHFYNARYEAAAALTLALRDSQPQDSWPRWAAHIALLFQLKGLLEEPADKNANGKEVGQERSASMVRALSRLIAAFMADVERARRSRKDG